MRMHWTFIAGFAAVLATPSQAQNRLEQAAAAMGQAARTPGIPKTPGRRGPRGPSQGKSTNWCHGSWACQIKCSQLKEKSHLRTTYPLLIGQNRNNR